jgi:hypothetical protein
VCERDIENECCMPACMFGGVFSSQAVNVAEKEGTKKDLADCGWRRKSRLLYVKDYGWW